MLAAYAAAACTTFWLCGQAGKQLELRAAGTPAALRQLSMSLPPQARNMYIRSPAQSKRCRRLLGGILGGVSNIPLRVSAPAICCWSGEPPRSETPLCLTRSLLGGYRRAGSCEAAAPAGGRVAADACARVHAPGPVAAAWRSNARAARCPDTHVERTFWLLRKIGVGTLLKLAGFHFMLVRALLLLPDWQCHAVAAVVHAVTL